MTDASNPEEVNDLAGAGGNDIAVAGVYVPAGAGHATALEDQDSHNMSVGEDESLSTPVRRINTIRNLKDITILNIIKLKNRVVIHTKTYAPMPSLYRLNKLNGFFYQTREFLLSPLYIKVILKKVGIDQTI